MDNNGPMKAQPRIVEMAQQVSTELIENFSAEEQYQFLQEVRSNVERNYEERIKDTDQNLASLQDKLNTFKGNHAAKALTHS